MQQKEKDSIQKCQKGNYEAFGEIYEAYIGKIYSYVFTRIKNKDTAQDITSQAFIKALENIHSFKSSKGTFSAWLYRIAHNTMIDTLRAQKRFVAIEDIEERGEANTIEQDAQNSMQTKKVLAYLDTLDPIQKDIILLRLWDDLPYKEIASIVNKSEGNCKIIYMRTLAKIQKEFSITAIICALWGITQ